MKFKTMPTLFIGNGLNRVYSDYSWFNLLESIKSKDVPDISNAPFTLQFEAIMNWLVQRVPGEPVKYSDIKQAAVKPLKGIPNSMSVALVRAFLELPVKTILTTNYDYCIEYALDQTFDPLRHRSGKMGDESETKYSLKRHVAIRDINIYHIHGEAKKPGSVCLGYEHYIASIQKLKNLLVDIESLDGTSDIASLFKEGIDTTTLWIRNFINEDLVFVGYGLDYSEIDIWWLLVYRATLINQTEMITNKIVFYGINLCTSFVNVLESMYVEVHNSTKVDLEDPKSLENYYFGIKAALRTRAVEDL